MGPVMLTGDASCDTVEYASTRLMSSWTMASRAAMTMVMEPITATKVSTPDGANTNTENSRPTRYTPAATMVAAWISADTGVGPAMASGSQVCSGNWPDFPIAPQNSSTAPSVMAPLESCPEWAASTILGISKLRAAQNSTKMPAMKPRSPTRVVRNALMAARELAWSSQ